MQAGAIDIHGYYPKDFKKLEQAKIRNLRVFTYKTNYIDPAKITDRKLEVGQHRNIVYSTSVDGKPAKIYFTRSSFKKKNYDTMLLEIESKGWFGSKIKHYAIFDPREYNKDKDLKIKRYRVYNLKKKKEIINLREKGEKHSIKVLYDRKDKVRLKRRMKTSRSEEKISKDIDKMEYNAKKLYDDFSRNENNMNLIKNHIGNNFIIHDGITILGYCPKKIRNLLATKTKGRFLNYRGLEDFPYACLYFDFNQFNQDKKHLEKNIGSNFILTLGKKEKLLSEKIGKVLTSLNKVNELYKSTFKRDSKKRIPTVKLKMKKSKKDGKVSYSWKIVQKPSLNNLEKSYKSILKRKTKDKTTLEKSKKEIIKKETKRSNTLKIVNKLYTSTFKRDPKGNISLDKFQVEKIKRGDKKGVIFSINSKTEVEEYSSWLLDRYNYTEKANKEERTEEERNRSEELGEPFKFSKLTGKEKEYMNAIMILQDSSRIILKDLEDFYRWQRKVCST